MPTRTHTYPTQIISFFVLGSFLTFVLFLGIAQEVHNGKTDSQEQFASPGSASSSKKKPDLDRYIWRGTLTDEELDFDDANRRLLFVGDIHGMKESLDKLLSKARYNPQTDHLIHVGDIVAKGPLDGSLDILSFMTQHNITGVRGNHDQMVIGWRAWIENILSQPSGRAWLEKLEGKSEKKQKEYLKELRKAVKKGKEDKWKDIPEGWEFMGDHYTVARRMNEEQAEYLRALPLAMHIPKLHAFVVHAGLLPLDPRRSATSGRQPLSRVPDGDKGRRKGDKKDDVERLRRKQEEAVLDDVPQNNDPWVLLNIRSILKDNSISRDSKEGSAWAPLWNSVVRRCGGFDLDLDFLALDNSASNTDSSNHTTDTSSSSNLHNFKNTLRITKQKPLPCYPSTVVYGHAASRGLDIKRWSKGLDTGCVYGRRLTSLVLTHPSSEDDPENDDDPDSDSNSDSDSDDGGSKLEELSKKKKMRFGDPGSRIGTRIVSVSCPDL